MEILMTGEIYIKKRPDIIEVGPTLIVNRLGAFEISEDEELEMLLEELEEDPTISKEMIEEIRQTHEDTKELEKNNKDYSGCSSFWMSLVGENGILMVEQTKVSDCDMKRVYKSKKELEEDFIRLRVFLEKAKYIGKSFVRTAPVYGMNPMGEKTEDRSYQYIPPLALYATDDCVLILVSEGYNKQNPKFSIVSSRYLEDGNYKFEGEVNNEYRDKAELYQAIFKQLTNDKKKTL